MSDLNIFNITSGINTTISQIIMSKNGPWYADLYKGVGNMSFYQLIADLKSGYGAVYQMKLRFSRELVEKSVIMSDDPFGKNWWLDKKNDIRVLKNYEDGNNLRFTLNDFSDRIIQRLENGYKYKTLCLHPQYSDSIRKAIEFKYGLLESNKIKITEEDTPF